MKSREDSECGVEERSVIWISAFSWSSRARAAGI